MGRGDGGWWYFKLPFQLSACTFEFTSAYGPNRSLAYTPFLESLEGLLDSAPSGDFLVILGGFSAYTGDLEVIRKNDPLDLNLSGVLLLNLCGHHRKSKANTIYVHLAPGQAAVR